MSEGASQSVAAAAPLRGAAVAFIFVTILLDTLALGVVIPILPKLIESFVNNDTANAARIFGLFGTVWALMQFFFYKPTSSTCSAANTNGKEDTFTFTKRRLNNYRCMSVLFILLDIDSKR